jgi:hypothetical protein
MNSLRVVTAVRVLFALARDSAFYANPVVEENLKKAA